MTPGSGIRGGLPEEKNVAQLVRENTTVYGRKYQALLDRSTPHVMERWLGTLGLFILFALNVVFRQGVRLLIQKMGGGADEIVVHRVLCSCYLHAQLVPCVPAASF